MSGWDVMAEPLTTVARLALIVLVVLRVRAVANDRARPAPVAASNWRTRCRSRVSDTSIVSAYNDALLVGLARRRGGHLRRGGRPGRDVRRPRAHRHRPSLGGLTSGRGSRNRPERMCAPPDRSAGLHREELGGHLLELAGPVVGSRSPGSARTSMRPRR